MSNTYKVNDNIIIELVDDCFVILDVKKNIFFQARDTSKEILEMIILEKDKKEIIETLIKEYKSPEIEKDVNDYIENLLLNNIIKEK